MLGEATSRISEPLRRRGGPKPNGVSKRKRPGHRRLPRLGNAWERRKRNVQAKDGRQP